MPLIPQNTNPLQDFVAPGVSPGMTSDGLVVDGVYGFTGVINTISTQVNVYQDPVTNQIYSPGQVTFGNPPIPTKWISNTVDDVYNTGYQLNFKFDRTTFINYVSMDILEVPLTWQLMWYNNSTITSGILSFGTIKSNSPDGRSQSNHITFEETYQFDSNIDLVLKLDKIPTGTQYKMGVSNFLTKLVVKEYSDITVSGVQIPNLTTQNIFGFIETYTPYVDSLSQMQTTVVQSGIGDPDPYWKSSPQPVGDAVVFFIIDFGYKNNIDTMYIDPLYTGNILNLYYSNDQIIWTPVNNDFYLRKGIFKLPQINARYIKLEFTRLTPEVYNLPFDSLQETVQVFPDWVDNYFSTIEQAIPNISSQLYYPLNTNETPNINYNVTPTINTTYGLAINSLDNATTYGNNNIPNNVGIANFGVTGENYSIVDPTISYKTIQNISDIGAIYSNLTNPTFMNRKFYLQGEHTYKDVTLNQTWHEAYFTGIKYLSFYSSLQTSQENHEEYFDSFYTVVSGNSTFPSQNSIINATTSSGITLVTSGGYTGSSNAFIQSYNLKTITPYSSFKFAALSTDWQPFLTPEETLLQGGLAITGVTVSGVPFSQANVNTANSGYGIYTMSGSKGTSYLQSTIGGGSNLLTTAEANFQTGGWSAGPTITNTSISGLSLVKIPLLTTTTWEAAYGESSYGFEGYGASVKFGQEQNQYDFLVTASGNGSVEIDIIYQSVSGTVVQDFSQTTVISGRTNLNFLTTQPVNSSQVAFKLTASGTVTFSEAGYFFGYTQNWVGPITTTNMRVSAVARVYLPTTNFGTYKCSLLSSTGQELAYSEVNSLPLKTWVDIQVPYTILSNTAGNTFQVKLTQLFGYQNGISETYRVAMLGIFYNPVAYQFAIDGTGTQWWNITTGINDANTIIQLPSSSNQIMLKATLLQDNTTINAVELVPLYRQNPYTNNTIINYLSGSKVNQTNKKTAAQQKPLFQLNSNLYPENYSLTQLFNIQNPYIL